MQRYLVWTALLAMMAAACDESVMAPDPDADPDVDPSAPVAITPALAVVYGPQAGAEIIAELGVLPVPEPESDAIAVADLNAAGRAVGRIGDIPATWAPDGTPMELPVPDGTAEAEPAAINNNDEIVGVVRIDNRYQPILWFGGGYTLLESLDETQHSYATDINDAGVIVGSSANRAVVWRDGTLDTLPSVPGYEESGVEWINDQGLMLGASVDTDVGTFGEERSVVWRDDALLWVDPTGVVANWYGISDSGRGYARSGHIWENGSLQEFVADTDQFGRVSASADGLVVGEISGNEGIFTADLVFHPWDDSVIAYCREVGEGGLVWCNSALGQDVIARADFDAEAPPYRVTDLSVSESTATSVTLTWTQVQDGAGEPANYRLKFAPRPIDYPTAEVVCDVASAENEIGAPASCTAEGLEPGTEYAFQLMSFRLDDGAWREAMYSNVAYAKTPMSGDPATVVTDLAATSVGATAVTVTWTQVDDGTGEPARYRIKYDEPPFDYSSATVCGTLEGDEIGAELSCTAEALDPLTEYVFRLASYRLEDGVWVDAEYSNAVTARTTQHADNAVADLRVVDRTSQTLTMAWTQVDDGTGEPAWYKLKFAEPPLDYGSPYAGYAPSCAFQGDEIGAEASCVIDGLTLGTEYEIQLYSFRFEDGIWVEAHESNVVRGSTSSVGPLAVTDLGSVGVGETSVNLRWTQVDDGTGSPARYRVKYDAPLEGWSDATIGCERTVVGDEIGATIGCTVEGLDPGTPYDFQVVSFRLEDGVWMSAQYSNVITRTPGVTGEPPTVDDLAVIDITSTTLTVRWTQINDGSLNPASSHPASYRVKYAVAPLTDWSTATVGCDPTIEGDDVGSDISCTITGLDPGITYQIQLASFWVDGGAWQDTRLSNVATGGTTGSQ